MATVHEEERTYPVYESYLSAMIERQGYNSHLGWSETSQFLIPEAYETVKKVDQFIKTKGSRTSAKYSKDLKLPLLLHRKIMDKGKEFPVSHETDKICVPSGVSHRVVEFDPSLNRHAWIMWRKAVTAEIIDDFLEVNKYESPILYRDIVADVLCHVPLACYVKVTPNTYDRLRVIHGDGPHKSRLKMGSFIYYGIPRAHLWETK